MILDLHKIRGRWAGSLRTPKRFSFEAGVFTDVEEPVVTEPIRHAKEQPNALEMLIGADAKESDVLVWKVVDGHGELRFRNAPSSAPLPSFYPARPGEQVALHWDREASYTIPHQWKSNAEIAHLFDEDQAVREHWPPKDIAAVIEQDRARRNRAKTLLESGALQSGDDFWHAAFIFQHGDTPADYLLAHSLAIVAAARGRADATWIAAATLDRYLQSIHQKQIYGTQYQWQGNGTAPSPTTQEPYDRTVIPDGLRTALGVPPLSAQEQKRQQYDEMRRNRQAGK
jgi:hypothetical protein